MTLPARLAHDLDGTFPELVAQLQDGVYSGVLRITGDRHDAEDLTQETFVRAYRALQSYAPERIRSLRLAGWTWTIAVNLCRNRARSLSRHPVAAGGGSQERVAAFADLGPGPEQLALEHDPPLAGHLAALPEPMRSAIVLRHVSGLSYREVSQALGRPEGTVKADVHRGLEQLRSRLEHERAAAARPLTEVRP